MIIDVLNRYKDKLIKESYDFSLPYEYMTFLNNEIYQVSISIEEINKQKEDKEFIKCKNCTKYKSYDCIVNDEMKYSEDYDLSNFYCKSFK